MNKELLNKELDLKAPAYVQARVMRINHWWTLQTHNTTSFFLLIYISIVM